MQTLFSLQQQPFFCPTKSNSWKYSKSPIILIHKSSQNAKYKKSWKVEAEAKGFNTKRTSAEGIKKSKQNSKNDEDDKIPDVVFERMISRILISVGVPLITGIVLLKIFDAIKLQHLWDFPYWLPFLTTFFTFGASALGLAYGTLSTSWDPERKGSVLGLDEAQQNWDVMWKEDQE